MVKDRQNAIVPLIGIAGGVGQIIYGYANLPEEGNGYSTNGSEKMLSFFNIGLGTTSILMSTWNLLSTSKKPKDQRTSWNLFSVPGVGNQNIVGLRVTRRF